MMRRMSSCFSRPRGVGSFAASSSASICAPWIRECSTSANMAGNNSRGSTPKMIQQLITTRASRGHWHRSCRETCSRWLHPKRQASSRWVKSARLRNSRRLFGSRDRMEREVRCCAFEKTQQDSGYAYGEQILDGKTEHECSVSEKGGNGRRTDLRIPQRGDRRRRYIRDLWTLGTLEPGVVVMLSGQHRYAASCSCPSATSLTSPSSLVRP